MLSSFLRPVLSAAVVCAFASCTSPRLPTVPPAAVDFPRASEAPVTAVHVMLVKPEMLPAFLAAKQDVPRAVGRWWRAGDGSVSLHVSTAKGRTLRGVECGGVLFVPGQPDEPIRLQVHNERELPIEAVISAHHADLLDGGGPSTIKPGVRIDPHTTEKISAQFDARSGQAVPLTFQPVAITNGLFRSDLAWQTGVIRIAVHPAKTWLKPLRFNPPTDPRSARLPITQRTSLPYEYR